MTHLHWNGFKEMHHASWNILPMLLCLLGFTPTSMETNASWVQLTFTVSLSMRNIFDTFWQLLLKSEKTLPRMSSSTSYQEKEPGELINVTRHWICLQFSMNHAPMMKHCTTILLKKLFIWTKVLLRSLMLGTSMMQKKIYHPKNPASKKVKYDLIL